MRIIKKYGNRRLYDMEESRYITVNEIKDLIIQNIDFQIKDAKTEEDLTNAVLLQIILEEESFSKPIFTTEILKNMIRFYGNPAQRVMTQYLEQMLQSFNQTNANSSFDMMKELAEKNMALWQKTWEGFLKK